MGTSSAELVMALLDDHITENQFRDALIEEAHLRNWLAYAVIDQRHHAKRTLSGYPDLTLMKDPWIIHAELKTSKGKLSPQQLHVLSVLEVIAKYNPTMYVCVWRPSDRDTISEILEHGFKPKPYTEIYLEWPGR